MKTYLTFVIPVRHQDNTRSWRRLTGQLKQTIASIANQDAPGWKAVIVANYGAELPDVPPNFDIKRVDFPPNRLHERGDATLGEFQEAVRSDKGKRVLAGMLHAGEMGHVMVVDNDDFVSRRLTAFVAANPNANGWYVTDGYAWTEGATILYKLGKFSTVCGTSLIIRSDLYDLPATLESADETYVRQRLGSHVQITEILAKAGTPLAPLPFRGAVYRIGHTESHSGSSGILRKYFLNGDMLRKPHRLAARIIKIRLKTGSTDQQFFGAG